MHFIIPPFAMATRISELEEQLVTAGVQHEEKLERQRMVRTGHNF